MKKIKSFKKKQKVKFINRVVREPIFRPYKSGKGEVINFVVSDGDDVIECIFFLNYSMKNSDLIKAKFKELKVDDGTIVEGITKLDDEYQAINILQLGIYVVTPVLQVIVDSIEHFTKSQIESKYEKDDERIEFQTRTKYGTLSSIVGLEEMVHKNVNLLKRKAVAVSDNSIARSFPYFEEAMNGNEAKAIYGVEFNVVENTLSPIINGIPNDIDIKDEELIFFDIETTGLRPLFNEIIEIGAIKVINGVIVDEFELLIKPKKEISEFITELTGIDNEMVKNAVNEKEALTQFKNFVKNTTLIGHNVKFDYSFLQHKYSKYKINDNLNANLTIDTLNMAIILLKEMNQYDTKSFRLNKLLNYYDEEINEHHRAKSDSESTYKLFNYMMSNFTSKKKDENDDFIVTIGFNDYKINSFKKMELIGQQYDDLRFGKSVLVYAKNQKGLKSLYELVTLANTKNGKHKMIPFHEILCRRENLIIGSGGFKAKIFEDLMGGNLKLDDLKKFDFIGIHSSKQEEALNDISEKEKELLNRILIKTVIDNNMNAVVLGSVTYMNSKDVKFKDVVTSEAKKNSFFFLDKQTINSSHLKTTKELRKEFHYLSDEVAYKIISENTIKLSEKFDEIEIVPKELAIPTLDDAEKKLSTIVDKKLKFLFGTEIPSLIQERVDYELQRIIDGGYAVIYYATSLIVERSIDKGFMVGSRGSVGSSYLANLIGITDVNSLPPHYYCGKCKTIDFIDEVESGFDLDSKKCEKCNLKMCVDGQNIPFELFLGFSSENGNSKIPDIDLNFSTLYHEETFKHLEELFGEDKVIRAGTYSSLADGKSNKSTFEHLLKKEDKEILLLEELYSDTKNFYYFDTKTQTRKKKKYVYSNGGKLIVEEYKEKEIGKEKIGFVERIKLNLNAIDLIEYRKFLEEVTFSTGVHSGGVLVIPKDKDLHDFFPITNSKDGRDEDTQTSGFDYRLMENSLLKFDNLRHNDPTRLYFLEKETGISPSSIDLNDKSIVKGFAEGKTERISEFNTVFSTNVTLEAQPKNFSDLVRISGLCHGTGVWEGNAQKLILNGKTIKEVIATREDLLATLISYGVDELVAFNIMEKVRKGKGINQEEKTMLLGFGVEEWYIDSANKVEYLFPSAHAVSYVKSAYLLMWYKLNYPKEFTKVILDMQVNKTNVDFSKVLLDKEDFITYVETLNLKMQNWNIDKTNKERSSVADYMLIKWFYLEGYSILPVDLNLSERENFTYEGEKSIRMPLSLVTDLRKADIDEIIKARENTFITIENMKELKITPKKIKSLKKFTRLDK